MSERPRITQRPTQTEVVSSGGGMGMGIGAAGVLLMALALAGCFSDSQSQPHWREGDIIETERMLIQIAGPPHHDAEHGWQYNILVQHKDEALRDYGPAYQASLDYLANEGTTTKAEQ